MGGCIYVAICGIIGFGGVIVFVEAGAPELAIASVVICLVMLLFAGKVIDYEDTSTAERNRRIEGLTLDIVKITGEVKSKISQNDHKSEAVGVSRYNAFPIIAIPKRVERYLTNDLPELDPIQAPTEPTKNLSHISMTVTVVMCGSGGLFVLNGSPLFGCILLFVAGVVVYNIPSTYRAGMKKYASELETYDDAIEQCRKRIDMQRKALSTLGDLKVNLKFRIGMINQILSVRDELSTSMFSDPMRGFSEIQFEHSLLRRFIGTIGSGKRLGDPTDNFAYTPDIVYESRKIGIDIEIDEPYVFASKEPIHYCEPDGGGHKDSDRNAYFTSAGWIVIRFSEQQVIETPNECILVVEYVIRVLEDGEFDSAKCLHKIANDIGHNLWTKRDAQLMAASNYRKKHNK